MAGPDTPLRPREATLAMLGAMLLIGVIDNAVPLIAQHVSVWQFFVVRTAFAAPMLVAFAWWRGVSLVPRRWGAVALRSGLIAAAMALYFGAMGFLTIAQALAGLFTAPIFVLVLTVLGGGTRVGPWRVAAVAMGFAGVLCVLQPGGDGVSALVLVPVMGGLLYACGSIITRTLCAGEETLTMLMGIFLAQAMLGGLGLMLTGGGADFVTRPWTWDMGPVMPWIVAQAALSLVGVGLLIWAYQNGEASKVAVFEYTVFVWAPLVAWLAYGQVVGPVMALGLGLIACAGAIIAVRS